MHGRVTGADGKPLHRAKVIVWWQHLRRRVELTSDHTDEDGRYCARYRVPDDFTGRLLIVVEATGAGLSTPLASPLTDAQPRLTIDLAVQAPDQSELASLLRKLQPFLEGLELTDLVESDTHHDVTFLARELNTGTESIMRAVAARVRLLRRAALPRR